MIRTLSGKLLSKEDGEFVVDVGGVGFGVRVPTSLYNKVQIGETLVLYTSLITHRDGGLDLYGFEHRDERSLFELLIRVNNIGPKLGLSILNTLSPQMIRSAIVNQQADIFNRVPGVGKKTAQSIIFHLKDKVGSMAELEAISRISDVDNDVFEALVSLGYSVIEAQSAIQAIPPDTPDDLETRLTAALKYFM